MRTRRILTVSACVAALCLLAACSKDKPTEPKPTPFWTARHADVAYHLRGACWGDAAFVTVGVSDAGTTVASLTSTDGVQWAATTYVYPGATGQLHDVVWTGTTYVARSLQGLYTSVDGNAYAKLTAYTAQPEAVAWSGAYLAASAYVGGQYVVDTSVTGATWGRIAATMPWSSVRRFCFGGGQWILIEGGSTPRIFRSTDLHTWTERAQLTAEVSDVAWSGSAFLLVCGSQAYRSTTGETWTPATLPGAFGSAVAWAGTAWIVAGAETYRSLDGATWTKIGNDPATLSIRDLAWSGQVLVGVGTSGTIFTATL
ncbi:MAG: hypothetical protein AB1644_08405 [Candidatus Zixiibacteriota bacterium]